MPRVLHVIDDLRGGLASAPVVSLIEASAKSTDGPPVIAVGRRPPRDAVSVCRVEWLGRRFSVDPFAMRRLARQIRECEPRVVLTWDNGSARLVRSLKRLGGLRGARWIAHVGERPLPPVVTKADVVLAADERLADAATSAGARCVRILRTVCAPGLGPVTPELRGAARARLREAGVDLPDGSTCVLIAGDFCDPHGLKHALWATDLFRVVRPGLRILVAGDGPARSICERFSAKALAPGLVTWLGDHYDAATCYAAVDAVWAPSGGEASPPAAVLAMQSGAALVIARNPARDGVWGDSPCAATVDAEDRPAWSRETARLLDDPTRAGADDPWKTAFLQRHSHEAGVTAYQAAVESALAG